jgi:hypothetical protein
MRGGAWVRSGGDGACDTRQRVRRRGRGAGVAGDDGGGGCAAKGVWGSGSALQRGGVVRWCCAWRRAHMQGARVSGGVNDPDICGL